jgi:hypothetical protein
VVSVKIACLGLWCIGKIFCMDLENQQNYYEDCYLFTSEFWPRRHPRALRAPFFMGSLTWQTGYSASHPPPNAASLFLPAKLMIFRENPAKNPSMGPSASFHWTTEVLKYNVPHPARRSFAVWEKLR